MDLGIADAQGVIEFCDQLRRSGVQSVDRFLERREDLRAIGKLHIAAALIRLELESTVLLASPQRGLWYRDWWDQVDSRPEHLLQNRLTVVTFNYDRSLEAFIFASLRSLYQLSPEEALHLTTCFPIVHVHGQLGAFTLHGGVGRPYEAGLGKPQVMLAAEGIQIVSEADGAGPGFIGARAALSTAERIRFLGFGYDRLSLRRLGFHEMDSWASSDMSGTAYGLTAEETRSVQKAFSRGQFVAGDPLHDVRDFLRHHIRLDE